jgi:pimeloyl-ACP methyl ester carboxylesterase
MLHVEETGNPGEKSILFIHAFSHCHLVWSTQRRADLAREVRMVSMDIRGHGLSDHAARSFMRSCRIADAEPSEERP